jgi:hypothetical protein
MIEHKNMAIQLTDIEEDDDIAPEPVRSRVGCITMGEGGHWSAVCPGLSYASEGVGPFDGLPAEALWLLNRDYKTVHALQDANRDLQLRLSGWMRIAMEDMPREWGIDDIESRGNAETVASIFDRVLKISLETAQKSAGAYRQGGDMNSSIERCPSLATGLRNLFKKDMDASIPSDTKVRKRISEALSYGVSRVQERRVADGEFMIHCQVPRLSHALRVTSHGVPAAGKWQKASAPDDMPLDDMVPELLKLDKPVMVVANAKERPGVTHDYFTSWVRPNNKAIRRISYTLEEVVALLPWFQFEEYSVIVGPDWRRSVTGRMVNNLAQVSGGREVASSSWSVNAAAENILCGGFRKLSGTENLSPECVWLTARDRLEMVRPIQALIDCGATLVSAYAGGIVVKVPEDPEMITMAANVIWEAGLHLPIGTVRQMQEMGVEPPYEASAFGGAPEDLILGQCLQRAQRNAMWLFDEILEQPQESRSAAFAAILG